MKTKLAILIVAATAVVSSLLVSSQQTGPAPDSPESQLEQPTSTTSTDGQIPYLLVDRTTWDVSDPFNQGMDLAAMNTPEAKWIRYKAALAMEAPAEYAKQYLPTPEEEAAMKAAAQAIEHPISLTEFLQLPRSPEEQQALLDSLVEPEPGAQQASQP